MLCYVIFLVYSEEIVFYMLILVVFIARSMMSS